LISLSPLPSVHPKTFQRLLVRTSRSFYRSFILTKGRSQSFASTPTDYAPCSDSLSLRMPALKRLTSPVRVTRRLIMQKARCHSTYGAPTACRRMVSGSLFTLLFGVLFTFPSQYWFSIGLSGVFSLTGWCRQFQTGRLRPRPTQDTTSPLALTFTGLSPSMVRFPTLFMFDPVQLCSPLTPHQP
jgi:hypothetical protein